MRKIMMMALMAAALSGGFSRAAAAGDTCRDASVRAKGQEMHTMRSAMASAYSAWQHEVRGHYGAAYSDYWYSGDRAVSCTWDDDGSHYRCAVVARPCARRR